MKKIIFTLFVLLSLYNYVGAQEIIDQNKTISASDLVLTENSMSASQKKAWDSISSEWYATDFKKILKENKIKKFGCSAFECEGFWASVVFKINDKGKLESYEFMHSGNCDCEKPFDKATEIRFMKEFLLMQCPELLKKSQVLLLIGPQHKY